MNIKEFADFITQQMDAKEALIKLLASTEHRYNEQTKQHEDKGSPLFVMAFAAFELGWQISVDKNDKTVNGLICGTEEYMAKFNKTV